MLPTTLGRHETAVNYSCDADLLVRSGLSSRSRPYQLVAVAMAKNITIMTASNSGQAKRRANKIQPKAIRDYIFGRFSNFDKCGPEVAGDVISTSSVAD